MRYIKSHFIKESNVPISLASHNCVSEVFEEIKSRVDFYDFKEGVEELKSMIELDDDGDIFSFIDHSPSWYIKSSSSKMRSDGRMTSVELGVEGISNAIKFNNTKYFAVRECNKFIRVSESSDNIILQSVFKIGVKGAFNYSGKTIRNIVKSTKMMVDQLVARSRSEGYTVEYFNQRLKPIEIDKIDYKKELSLTGNPSRSLMFVISKKLDKNPFKVDFDIPNDKLDRFNEFAKKYRISNADKLEIINLFKN